MKTPRQIFRASQRYATAKGLAHAISTGWMLLLLATTTFTFTQCGSDEARPNKKTDVYIAGRFHNGTNAVPAYWKNGIVKELSSEAGEADAIAVIGDDVYVIGELSGSDKKKLWTNNNMTDLSNLPNTYDYVYSMRVFGDEWYAVGMHTNSTGDHAAYWKNGVLHILPSDFGSRAHDIAVDDTDVYVVGWQRDEQGTAVATYWLNDDDETLTNGDVYSEAYGIAIGNDGVYISGNENGTLKVWKNKSPLTMEDAGDSYTGLGSIAVLNNDIYVVGYLSTGGSNVAKYWKNGVPKMLSSPENATQGFGYTVASNGKDIYFLGEAFIVSGYHTLVWKNFELVEPFDGIENGQNYGYGITLAK
jgi:hypothetical protein